MVTVTTLPSILYTPLTPLAEKFPDVSFPLKTASFSIAALLAMATNVPGSFAEIRLNVLGIIWLLLPIAKQGFNSRVRHGHGWFLPARPAKNPRDWRAQCRG